MIQYYHINLVIIMLSIVIYSILNFFFIYLESLQSISMSPLLLFFIVR